MSKFQKRESFEYLHLQNKLTQNKRELPKVSSQANNQKNKTMMFTQHSLEYSQINSISATELGKGAQRLMPLSQLSQPMAISSISQKDPQQPKNFYHHSTIYRINEYKDLSQHQLYISSGTRINSLQDNERIKKSLIADFKRNVAEYLMSINYNKDLALRTFRKFYANKTHHQLTQDFPSILNNTVISSKLIMDYSNCHLPRQISNNTFNYKLLEVDVLVLDREGRSQKRRVDHKQLQQSLIRRMEPFLNSEKIDYDAKMYLMMRQYEEIVDRIYDESFLVRLSVNMHPNSNPNYNDFYEYGDANLTQPRSNYSFHEQLIQCSVSPLPSDLQFETIHQSIVLEEDQQEAEEEEEYDEDDDEDTKRKKRQVKNRVKKEVLNNGDDIPMQKKIYVEQTTVSQFNEDQPQLIDHNAQNLKRAKERLERRIDIERVQRELQINNTSEEFKYNTERTEEEEIRYDQRSSTKKQKKKLENPSSSVLPDKRIQKQKTKKVINPILDNIQPMIVDQNVEEQVQSKPQQKTGRMKPTVQQQQKQKTEEQLKQNIQIGQPELKHSLTSNDPNPVQLNLNQPLIQLKDIQQVKQDQQGQKQNKDYNGRQQSKNQKIIIPQKQDNNQETNTKGIPTVQQIETNEINGSNNLDIQKTNQKQNVVQSPSIINDNKDQMKQSFNQKEQIQSIKSPHSPKKNNDIQSPNRKGGKVAFPSQKISTFGENATNKIIIDNEMNVIQLEDSLLNEKGYQENYQSQTDAGGNSVFYPTKYITEEEMNKHRNFIDVMLECDNCYDEEIVEWKISQFDMNLLVMPNLEKIEDRGIYKDLYAWKEEIPYVIPRLRMLNMMADPDPNEEQLELEEERKEKEKKTQKDEKKREKDLKKDRGKLNNINEKIK